MGQARDEVVPIETPWRQGTGRKCHPSVSCGFAIDRAGLPATRASAAISPRFSCSRTSAGPRMNRRDADVGELEDIAHGEARGAAGIAEIDLAAAGPGGSAGEAGSRER